MTRSYSIESKVRSHNGFLGLDTVRLRHTLFSGEQSPEIARERVDAFEAVAVLLYDPRQDKVVLIEQFRVGAVDDPRGPWLVEVVGGIVEPGESQEQVACREALEEAGCEVLRLEPIVSLWVSPGFSNERLHLYYGEVDSTGVGGIHGLVEEGEDILVRLLPACEALDSLYAGEYRATSILLSLQWLAINRARLRAGS